MLPFSKADQQQIERKRHIGNDVVVIIFLESGGNFDPNSFVGQFNCNQFFGFIQKLIYFFKKQMFFV